MKATKGEKLFYGLNYLFLAACGLLAVFPFLYIVAVSVTPYVEVIRHGGFIILPRQITFEAYRQLFAESEIPRAFLNSVFITVTSTALGLVLTTMLAFGLAKKSLPGRQTILLLLLFTMFFSGGLIPQYLLMKWLGLLNTYGVLILSGTLSVFNMFVMKGFFENLPDGLEEAALIDGASELQTLWKVILPLSRPVMATIGLFYAVGHWNSFFEAVLYVRDTAKHPLQPVLQKMLMVPDASEILGSIEDYVPSEAVKMAAVVVSILPILLVYPFLQKHFTKGVLLGSIKG
ncbi:carbohydrate ABC transporter permease [Paenibacillus contaminans]|uniref:ABC transporter permease n=1 Tax=Paenibacillus contaminans TaxID=450362 RepID=A0A329LZQ8_9BACL|nr:carbohydrate ABC transporter permease [Paenibacillus contaminans]RAV12958.1 ABC transporter permease [Paenibacillus contaminans]